MALADAERNSKNASQGENSRNHAPKVMEEEPPQMPQCVKMIRSLETDYKLLYLKTSIEGISRKYMDALKQNAEATQNQECVLTPRSGTRWRSS
jgi:hypothetical protein